MTVQRHTPGSGPSRVDPPTRFYRPVSDQTAPEEDPDQVVDEWEEALRGDESSPAPLDPPTRRWVPPPSTRTGPTPGDPPRRRQGPNLDYPTRVFTPPGSEPDRASAADDSSFSAFTDEPYLPPVHEPDDPPGRPSAVDRALRAVETAVESSRPKDPEPAPPGSVAEQLFGPYIPVEEPSSTGVMPRIEDDDHAAPPEAEPEPEPDADPVADWLEPEYADPADDTEHTDESEQAEDEPPAEVAEHDRDDLAEFALTEADHDYTDLPHTDPEPAAEVDVDDTDDTHHDTHHEPSDGIHADTVHINTVHAATLRVRLPVAEPDHDDHDHDPDHDAPGANHDLGDTAEWTMGSLDDDEDEDHYDDQPRRPEAHTELIPRVDQPTVMHETYDPTASYHVEETAEEAAETAPEPDAENDASPTKPLAALLALLLVTIVAGAGAYIFSTKADEAVEARRTDNLAFVDKAVTADVRDQVSKAIEAIYSYDAAHLDEDEQRALSYIAGSYADEFKEKFAQVRQLGPQQKASLESSVAEAGVERITDRRASLLVLVNQVGRRADSSAPLKASVRFAVTAERVGGQWKVSGISQR